ncbi:hypothetical protein M1E17_17035 [Arthrobacter sp. D1-29]
MKRILAAAAVAGVAALIACSVSTPVPETTTSAAEATPSKSSGPRTTTAGGGGVKAACELFNMLHSDYKAVPKNDVKGYQGIYLESEEAKETVPKDVYGLFAALSLIAIDHASAAGQGGGPKQTSKDAVADAVDAYSGPCTAAGVALKL